MRIYLCGPINGCNDEASQWRDQFKGRDLVAEYVDPMERDYRGKERENYREIVELDKRDIRTCDAVLAMHDKPSVGSSMEILFAWTLGIPVVVINRSCGPISPWLQYHATVVVGAEHLAEDKLRQWSQPVR